MALPLELHLARRGTRVQGYVPRTGEEMEFYFGHLEQTLIAIGFLNPEQPKHLMARLRRLYGRSSVNRSEISILRGILTETQKFARGDAPQRKD